jgi:hypothetical protein
MPAVLIIVAITIEVVALFILRLLTLLAMVLMVPVAQWFARSIPIVGKSIADKANDLGRWTKAQWDSFIASQAQPLTDAINAVAHMGRDFSEAVAATTVTLGNAIWKLEHVTLPDALDKSWASIAGDLSALRTDLLNPRTGKLVGLTAMVAALEADLLKALTGRIPKLETGLDAIRAEWFHPLTGRIPTVERGINFLDSFLLDRITGFVPWVRLSVATLNDAVFPHGGLSLPDIRGKVTDLWDERGHYLPWVATAAGAVAVTDLVNTVRGYGRCKDKLDVACTTDLFEWTDWVLGIALLGAIPSLDEIVEEVQTLTEELLPAVMDLVE